MSQKPTLGEARVGIGFNPGGHPEINAVKRALADLIDRVNALPDHSEGEVSRVKAIAMTKIEGAGHWAVKAAARSAAAARD